MRSREKEATTGSTSTPTIGRHITDEDIERYLARTEDDAPGGFWNLPTVTGLGLIAVGTAYIFQQLGFWDGVQLDMLVAMLPWLAGILIILIGLGILSHEPRSKQSPKEQTLSATSTGESSAAAEPSGSHQTSHQSSSTVSDLSIGQAAKNFVGAIRHTLREKRLVKSRDKKISGVCGGLAEYFGIDPTIVRLAFVVLTIFGSGVPILLYIGLLIAMPGPEESVGENTPVSVTRG